MRNAAVDASLEIALSRQRLGKYLAVTHGRLDDALTLYERNTRLSEAFYSPLHCMEVCFRNKLSIEMVALYGADWLVNNAAPLASDANDAVRQAVGTTRTGNDIVAELHFGFWVGLIGKRYDGTLWRKGLHKAFRAQGGKRRSDVHGRFNALRRFRNRIAHHEPIFDRPLEHMHHEIIEAIGWMCRDTSTWASYHSRFDDVFHGRAV